MSFREFLWKYIYARGEAMVIPSPDLLTKEIVTSAVICLLVIVLCWFILRKMLFLLCERAWHSRVTALSFGIFISIAWLIGSLELLGFYSTRWMLILVVITILINGIFLAIAKSK